MDHVSAVPFGIRFFQMPYCQVSLLGKVSVKTWKISCFTISCQNLLGENVKEEKM